MIPTKYKIDKWIDTETLRIAYGISANINGRWLKCSVNGSPLFFDTEGVARRKLKTLTERK